MDYVLYICTSNSSNKYLDIKEMEIVYKNNPNPNFSHKDGKWSEFK